MSAPFLPGFHSLAIFAVLLFPICFLGKFLVPLPTEVTDWALPLPDLPVSILIPVFNRARYLNRSLQSALNQTLTSLEVIVIDDASTDNSAEIAQNASQTDPRVRLVRHHRNLGTHAARRTGVFAARGQYILSLDPDDLLLPRTAELAVRTALVHRVDIVEFQVLECLNGSSDCVFFNFHPPPTTRGRGRYLRKLFIRRRLGWNIWKRLILRDLYIKALSLLPNETFYSRIVYGEDKLHTGLVILLADAFYYMREYGYVYNGMLPENSESGTQQSANICVQQLRFVEQTLVELYARVGNLSYVMDMRIPTGLQGRVANGTEAPQQSTVF
jgi:glycosyltransferase involved in cell wall biosynthesis